MIQLVSKNIIDTMTQLEKMFFVIEKRFWNQDKTTLKIDLNSAIVFLMKKSRKAVVSFEYKIIIENRLHKSIHISVTRRK